MDREHQPGRRTTERPRDAHRQRPESTLIGGLIGIGAVALATMALALAGALIAFVVALLV